MSVSYQLNKKCWRATRGLRGKQHLLGTFKKERHAVLADLLWKDFFDELIMRDCSWCGERFTPTNGSSRYCSASHRGKAHYQRNKELNSEACAKYYIANRDRRVEVKSAWRKNNAEKTRMLARRRHYRKRGALGSHSLEEWNGLLQLFQNRCVGCSSNKVKLTEDHKVPIVKFGTNYIDNIQPLCRPCNSSKHTKTMFPVCDLITKLVHLHPAE